MELGSAKNLKAPKGFHSNKKVEKTVLTLCSAVIMNAIVIPVCRPVAKGGGQRGPCPPAKSSCPPADFDTEHQLGVSKMQQNVYLQLRNTLYAAVFADAA